MFIFGADVDQVNKIRDEMHKGKRDYVGGRLKEVFDSIRRGDFGDLSACHYIMEHLVNGGDHYIVCSDFYPYISA